MPSDNSSKKTAGECDCGAHAERCVCNQPSGANEKRGGLASALRRLLKG